MRRGAQDGDSVCDAAQEQNVSRELARTSTPGAAATGATIAKLGVVVVESEQVVRCSVLAGLLRVTDLT